MVNLTRESINKAIRAYVKGERPFRFTEPRAWYVVDKSDRIYPLKYIYAIATGKRPSSFNTSSPIKELQELGFVLRRIPKLPLDFETKVSASLSDPQGRAARLAKAPRKPGQRLVQTVVYDRNPDVVAEVLVRAKGVCEMCGKAAPFLRRKDQTPYLEVHHKDLLANDGDDTVENAVALCPNCHRREHHG